MRSGARNKLGQQGEHLAAEFLVGKGYVLLGQNETYKQGEIDLLMRDGDTIVVVEVKTQSSDKFLDPIYKVGPAKKQKLRLLGQIIAEKYPDTMIRIDVVTVCYSLNSATPLITHLENVI